MRSHNVGTTREPRQHTPDDEAVASLLAGRIPCDAGPQRAARDHGAVCAGVVLRLQALLLPQPPPLPVSAICAALLRGATTVSRASLHAS